MSLTSTGYARKRLNDIKAEYDALTTEALGAVNTNADSVIGQLLGIFSEAIDNAEETLQNTYDAMYPYSAEGTSLDGSVSFVGMARIGSTPTIATACAYGVEGTVIVAGAEAHADIEYISTDDMIISRSNSLDITIEVNTVSNSAVYNLFLGGMSQTYTSDASATKLEIVTGIAALYNTGNFLSEVIGETVRIYSADGKTPFSATIDTKLTITKLGSAIQFAAKVDGANALPVGALVNIDSGKVTGWDSLTNLAPGTTGRNVETDAELRARHLAGGARGSGSATVEAIRARVLQNIPEVSTISIYENRTAFTDVDGVPPHSFEAIIQGGSDSDIADALWLYKPAGIQTHGSINVTVQDSNGENQTVGFSRPVTKYGWLNIQVTTYSEESLPSTASIAIKQACVEYANANMIIGKDVILQRFYGAIYDAVGGIGNLDITADLTDLETDTPSYVSTNIPVSKSELAVFDISRIVVSGV